MDWGRHILDKHNGWLLLFKMNIAIHSMLSNLFIQIMISNMRQFGYKSRTLITTADIVSV